MKAANRSVGGVKTTDRAYTPVLIGPFGLPQHGVTIINEKLAALLEARGATPERIDMSPGRAGRGLMHHLIRASRAFRGVIRILSAKRPRRYEMSVDGGAGLIYNILFAAAARLRSAPLILYHHSAGYIVTDSTLMRLLLLVSGTNALHVACSDKMFAMLRERYDVKNKVLILSNPAWITPSKLAQMPPAPDIITLGYLSALQEEKGVLRALETFRKLRMMGVKARILFAGGGESILVRNVLEAAAAKFGPDVRLLGSLPNAEIWPFLSSLDYLLFPTLYRFETQSSVTSEALAAGVPVVTYDHRFVSEIVAPDGGYVIPVTEPFAEAAAAWIAADTSLETRLARRSLARRHYENIHAEARSQLDTFLAEMIAQD